MLGGTNHSPPVSLQLVHGLLVLIGLLGASAITLKAEYLRYDLGSRNVLVNNTGLGAPATGSYTSRFNTEGNLIKAGFNYKFGSM